MFIFGETLFASEVFSREDKAWLFTLCAHKLLFLMVENKESSLIYLYSSALLYHIYRFIILYEVDCGGFHFRAHRKIAFFPGTFDPFTLSHKAIVQAIRDLGFEVYLAIDEFSWSKKTQPSLIRRQIASMNKAFWLPPRFCALETANDAGAAARLPGIEERMRIFAGNLAGQLAEK